MKCRVSPPYTGPDDGLWRNCSHCHRPYPWTLENFCRNTSSDSPSSICRPCHRAMVRARYYKDHGKEPPADFEKLSTHPPRAYWLDGNLVRECSHCHEVKPYDKAHFWRRPSAVEPGSVCWPCHRIAAKSYHSAAKRQGEKGEKHEKKQQTRRPRPSGDHREGCAYQVIKDPDRDCGFRPGALISSIEVEMMLPAKSFTPGTELARRGKRFVVEAVRTPAGSVVQRLKELEL